MSYTEEEAEKFTQFLKDKLQVTVTSNTEYDYSTKYTTVEVSLSIDGEVICEHSDSL